MPVSLLQVGLTGLYRYIFFFRLDHAAHLGGLASGYLLSTNLPLKVPQQYSSQLDELGPRWDQTMAKVKAQWPRKS